MGLGRLGRNSQKVPHGRPFFQPCRGPDEPEGGSQPAAEGGNKDGPDASRAMRRRVPRVASEILLEAVRFEALPPLGWW
jgi:hypothetical protein